MEDVDQPYERKTDKQRFHAETSLHSKIVTPQSDIVAQRGVTIVSDNPSKPSAPDVPAYLQDPLERQLPDRLESIADYATELASWKRRKREHELKQKRAEEAVDDEELESLEEREIATDPEEYEDVPTSGAYITMKETKPGYYFWLV